MTRRGGGAALPWKTDLFTAIVQTAVKEASRNDIPLTIKMRKGIDDDHITFPWNPPRLRVMPVLRRCPARSYCNEAAHER